MIKQPLCAWCHTAPAGKLLPHGLVSHGICQGCASKVMRELEVSKLEAWWQLEPDDGLDPARGIVAGLVLAVGLWGLGAMVWRWIL